MKNSLNIRGNLLDLSDPIVMGVLNVTPDSFYSGSIVKNEDQVLRMAARMIEEGATMLDIGGHSTRPGSGSVSTEVELNRVLPTIDAVLKEFPKALISIDTFNSKVASEAIRHGVSIINDISGGILDEHMFDTAIELKVPFIVGHIQGKFDNMMNQTNYKDLVMDLMDHFARRIRVLQDSGVNDIIVDPCFGFSKTLDQNFHLLKNLAYFRNLGLPVMAGLSRKSMIYNFLEISPEEALNGTTALNTIALQNGASILRVHDVKEAVQTIKLFQKTNN